MDFKLDLNFDKDVFEYSGGKQKNLRDVDSVLIATLNMENSSSLRTNSVENNSNDPMKDVKKLNFFSVSRGEDMQSESFSADLIGEETLSCGNYKGNNSVKKLPELLSDLVVEHRGNSEKVVAFIFKKDSQIKGYLVFVVKDNKVVVEHICSSSVLEHLREEEVREDLIPYLEDESLDDFMKNTFLKEDNKAAANNDLDTNTDNFKPSRNFNVVLALAKHVAEAVGIEDTEKGFFQFSENIPRFQIRSLFAVFSVERSKDKKANKTVKSLQIPSSLKNNLDKITSGSKVRLSSIKLLPESAANNSSTIKAQLTGTLEVDKDQDVEQCSIVKVKVFYNGTEIDLSDGSESEFNSLEQKGSQRKRGFIVVLGLSKDEYNCEGTFKLQVVVKCSNDDELESAEKDVSNLFRAMLKCDKKGKNSSSISSAKNSDKLKSKKNTSAGNNAGNGRNNSGNGRNNTAKKTKKVRSVATSTRNNANGEDNVNTEGNVEAENKGEAKPQMRNQGVGPSNEFRSMMEGKKKEGENSESEMNSDFELDDEFDLRDIQKVGSNFYYIKRVYNVQGDLVEGDKVALPSKFMESIGIKSSDFKVDESDGKIHLNPDVRPSKSSKAILKQRIQSKVTEQLDREGTDESRKSEREKVKESPQERKRRQIFEFEQKKFETKIKREQEKDKMKMQQFEKQREDQLEKRQDQREKERRGEDRKYLEMVMRMQDKDAQRRISEGKGTSGDKQMMEKMMKMMMDQKQAKQPAPVVMKERRSKEGTGMMPVVQRQEKGKEAKKRKPSGEKKQRRRSSSRSRDKLKLRKYRELVKKLRAKQSKKAPKPEKKSKAAKKTKEKPKISKKLRTMIIKKYREQKIVKKYMSRKHRKHRKSRHGKREEEQSKHGHKKRHTRKLEREKEEHKSKHHRKSRRSHHSKHHKEEEALNQPEKEKKGKK